MSAAVNRISKCPCRGCTERFVVDGHRCHATCERYSKWRGEVDNVAEYLREEASKTYDADFLFAEKCIRYRKAINRIPKKKG